MKNFKIPIAAICAALCLFSCDFNLQRQETDPGSGYLRLRFPGTAASSKAYGEIPDTSEFRIRISSSSGQAVFDGYYYDIPGDLGLPPGKYSVSAVSCEFNEPLFDCPQYGYATDVEITAGKTSCVILDCAQTNAGIRLLFDPEFRSAYPSAQIYLSCPNGRLLFGYAEKRTAYFLPGTINISLFEGNSGRSIANRSVKAQEMLILKLHSNDLVAEAEGLEFQLDTSIIRKKEDIYWGFQGSSSTEGQPDPGFISVPMAESHIGEKGVWVSGYIAGLSKSSSSSEFQSPFSSNTNLLLSPTANNTDRKSCIAVELPKGEIRDALNLKDHPGFLNRKIRIKGNIEESYFGLVGLKKISAYEWE